MLGCLAVYWPLVFIATHMPVPKIVGSMGMTDKNLHYLAYLMLITFLWQTVSPYKKVNWKEPKIWIILAIIIWYGAFDEWLQGFVNRSPDVHDFKADFAGAMTGIIIFTIFSFWPALLMVLSVLIFSATNITSNTMLLDSELVNAGFYFLSYSVFVLIWVQVISQNIGIKSIGRKWWALVLAGPAVLMGMILAGSIVLGKGIWIYDIVAASAGAITATVISFLIFRVKKQTTSLETSASTEDRQ